MPIKYRYLITNGELGTLDQHFAHYSVHPNGRRALFAAIQQHADNTGRESWAYPWPEGGELDTKNRYYPKAPQNA